MLRYRARAELAQAESAESAQAELAQAESAQAESVQAVMVYDVGVSVLYENTPMKIEEFHIQIDDNKWKSHDKWFFITYVLGPTRFNDKIERQTLSYAKVKPLEVSFPSIMFDIPNELGSGVNVTNDEGIVYKGRLVEFKKILHNKGTHEEIYTEHTIRKGRQTIVIRKRLS